MTLTEAHEERMPAAREELDLERMAEWLRPLASPVRLRLLRYLTRPHYLEEVASHLKVSRQAARKQLDQLVAIGVLERRAGVRASGPVTEFLVNTEALFVLFDEFEKLGTLQSQEPRASMHRTVSKPGQRYVPPPQEGPCFSIVRGLNAGQRVPLERSPGRDWVLGRDARCDFVVSYDPFASNRHAEVRWDGRQFVLADLRSTNGTMHNWVLLPRGGSVALRHGDLVGVGKTLLLFWDAPPKP